MCIYFVLRSIFFLKYEASKANSTVLIDINNKNKYNKVENIGHSKILMHANGTLIYPLVKSEASSMNGIVTMDKYEKKITTKFGIYIIVT